jgi:uncharacterized membrane protein YdjX (TVP38/TMEM64 family)
MSRELNRLIALGVGVLGAMLVLWVSRRVLGIDFDPVSLRSLVSDLGPLGPTIFVGLTGFRLLLGMPSQLLLVVGGLCFGAVAGTIYGALGLTLSGLGLFLTARWVGRDAVARRIPERLQELFDGAGSRAGVAIVAVGTGYPMGPISAYHTFAGVTSMTLTSFTLAVVAGSTIRSATYTYFGSSLADGSTTSLLVATGLLVCAGLLPFAFPRSRKWILRMLVGRGELGLATPSSSSPDGEDSEPSPP